MLNMRSHGFFTMHNDYGGIYLANLSKRLASILVDKYLMLIAVYIAEAYSEPSQTSKILVI